MSIVPETERQLRDAAERMAKRPVSRARVRRRGVVAASFVLLAACALGLVLAGGSSGPGVDVAAAAYKASAPGTGVLEADFVDRLFSRGRLVAIVQRREWIDASRGRLRAQRITRPAGRRCASVIVETASAPSRVEFASGAKACPRPAPGSGTIPTPKVISRLDLATPHTGSAGASDSSPAVTPTKRPRVTVPPEVLLGAGRDACTCFSPSQASQGDGAPLETEGLGLYRRLYREHVMRLVGQVRMGGRLLWKLEGDVAWASRNTRTGRFHPILGLVVLVDPTNFRPVIQREVNLALPGHPVTVESRLVGYRRLPRDSASEALLQISTQRPGLRVITLATVHAVSRRR